MKLTTDFDKLGFHDASIEKIERQSESVILDIKGAFISKEHPGSGGQDWKVEEATLEILGVAEERATYWDDDKAAKDHPEPKFPLDEIMHAYFMDGVFLFEGFKQTEPWYEWFITANSFILEVKSASKLSS
ncbi:hypothetical protein Q4567_18730 [Aliiglaciecola sp. 2_MG-2023]|uniref:hypothetical protein n=1 Tax=unclassified Aliiglaciecola TaxID=2593648 RepID=UPI0026E20D35|nr:MULTISPECIES: hypothetical protein [unclassified Aliiglaciecola]MDO6712777.1 hypothetical protein [Aliiglaciecola sp. 2_MG-2023]MDO6753824.1 hypothetical protein [Aliiglaciecola sp. 1_MG-2023]